MGWEGHLSRNDATFGARSWTVVGEAEDSALEEEGLTDMTENCVGNQIKTETNFLKFRDTGPGL